MRLYRPKVSFNMTNSFLKNWYWTFKKIQEFQSLCLKQGMVKIGNWKTTIGKFNCFAIFFLTTFHGSLTTSNSEHGKNVFINQECLEPRSGLQRNWRCSSIRKRRQNTKSGASKLLTFGTSKTQAFMRNICGIFGKSNKLRYYFRL